MSGIIFARREEVKGGRGGRYEENRARIILLFSFFFFLLFYVSTLDITRGSKYISPIDLEPRVLLLIEIYSNI